MSILPVAHSASQTPRTAESEPVCTGTRCKAKPSILLSTAPLCWDCALAVTAEVFANRPEPEADAPAVTDAQVAQRTPRGLVYFVRFGDRVKIGFTTNLTQRMAVIPHDEILATQPGSLQDEARCHAAFAADRLIGEWFKATPDLLAFAAAVDSGVR